MLQRWLDRRPEIAAHDVVTRAIHRTRSEDFGGLAWSEPLDVLTRSLDREARLTRAGRLRVRRDLVAQLAARAAPAGDEPPADRGPEHAPVFVVGLPATEGLGDALRAGTTPNAVDPFAFVSLRHEERWHVPGYAEWLSEADLTPSYESARRSLAGEERPHRPRRVVEGAVHLEHVDLIARVLPSATVVHVRTDVAASVRATAERSLVLRRRDSDEADADKVHRYWEWRVGVMAEHGATALASFTGRLVEVDHGEVAAAPDAVARQVWASIAGA
ncbi:MAG: sulfotransferase [Acidimicrobiales bacterium]